MDKKAIIDAYIAIKKSGVLSDDVLEFMYTCCISACESLPDTGPVPQSAIYAEPPVPAALPITAGPPASVQATEESVEKVQSPVRTAMKIKSFDEFSNTIAKNTR